MALNVEGRSSRQRTKRNGAKIEENGLYFTVVNYTHTHTHTHTPIHPPTPLPLVRARRTALEVHFRRAWLFSPDVQGFLSPSSSVSSRRRLENLEGSRSHRCRLPAGEEGAAREGGRG